MQAFLRAYTIIRIEPTNPSPINYECDPPPVCISVLKMQVSNVQLLRQEGKGARTLPATMLARLVLIN
jgi:hypothetical protein